MGTFSAITPGTDLPRYARELSRMHDALIGGGRSAMRPRTVVQRSWARVLGAGLAPDRTNTRALLPFAEVERRRSRSPLSGVIDDLAQVVAAVAEASQLLMVVTDADGIILWRAGSARVRERANVLGFRDGAQWTETAVGTNAIGTAIAEAAPVQLFSAEHFEQAQHPWYCTAAPIHDPRTGELLGVVDVSGPALTLHPTISALVATAVRMAEAQLWRHHEHRLERLRTTAAPLLASVSGPLLLVDEHGWVAHTSGVAATRRIAAPRNERAVTVPGLGMCLPEPVAGGWLIRPTGAATRILMELDLSDPPTVQVTGTDSTWRAPVTARHAEILLLLHQRGRRGMSVADLSSGVYGDPDHAVAVRAEISRLRRALGSVVEGRPYRLADSIELSLTFGDAERLADCAFVRRAASPAVRALAGPQGD
ncbi:GAF domain-containing protein [Rhodococcus sp. NPDC127528]|uniref:helix-turn-helix domain-containing protein n=1 Tax=unclassified Rhodococcus (in: high G+C Gram-positive bacteria) TaxID=192944 RepID=UPI003626B0F1